MTAVLANHTYDFVSQMRELSCFTVSQLAGLCKYLNVRNTGSKAVLITAIIARRFTTNGNSHSDVGVEEISQGDDVQKKKIYTACVKDIYGKDIAFGTAKSKKEAQQLAAKEACRIFGIKVSQSVNYYLKTL